MNEQIDLAATDSCQNRSESYGEVCVRCNKCGRIDQENRIEVITYEQDRFNHFINTAIFNT